MKRKGKVKTREVDGERERVVIKRICLDRVSGKAFEVFCPNAEVESVEEFSDVNVNVLCEVVFSDVCGSADLVSRERTRSKCGLWKVRLK